VQKPNEKNNGKLFIVGPVAEEAFK
jgi:hypothetical protein